jgi:hypothetical protein
MMNALTVPVTVVDTGRSSRKIVLFNFRLLWAGLDIAQSIRAASKIIAMAYDKWRQLQCRAVGGNLEQFRRVGWNGG